MLRWSPLAAIGKIALPPAFQIGRTPSTSVWGAVKIAVLDKVANWETVPTGTVSFRQLLSICLRRNCLPNLSHEIRVDVI